jgi:hypothetical protein
MGDRKIILKSVLDMYSAKLWADPDVLEESPAFRKSRGLLDYVINYQVLQKQQVEFICLYKREISFIPFIRLSTQNSCAI